MKPNLVFVIADQLRYSSVGFNNDEKAITPNLDALCRESVNLRGAVSGHPVCAPYRASLFTGKYTTSTGMVINELRMNTNHRTFANVLGDAGYENSYIGKWHMYAAEYGNHGDTKNSFIPPGPNRLGFNGYFAAYNFHHGYYGESAYYHLDTAEKIYVEGYEPDAQTDMAIEQIDRLSKGSKPFALFLALGTPHDPWLPENVPSEYLQYFKDVKFELPCNYDAKDDPYADEWATLKPGEREQITEWMKCYYAMTTNLDDNIGRLVKTIKSMGLDRDTIFVFTSDHGECFGAHGRRAKNCFYEEAVRVPFLISRKGILPDNVERDFCFNTVDIMPTLLSLMNIPIPAGVEGCDLSMCVRDGEDTDEGSLMMCTGPTADYADGYEWRAYRTKQYTYGIYKRDGTEYLFDNISDPFQMINLIDDPKYASLADTLKDKMYSKMSSINDTFENCSYYRDNWIEDRVIKRTATLK